MLLERVSSTMSSKRSSAGSTKKKVQPKKREGFGAVWASRSKLCLSVKNRNCLKSFKKNFAYDQVTF